MFLLAAGGLADGGAHDMCALSTPLHSCNAERLLDIVASQGSASEAAFAPTGTASGTRASISVV